MFKKILFLLSAVEAKYRILSLDSATYAGLMTAEFVSFMEKKAYLIARNSKCLTPRPDERIAMHELFDMIAGSETGAIIASTLVVPNDDPNAAQKNKYWATKSVEFFMETTDELYVDSGTSVGLKILITALFLIFFGAVTYKLAEYYFKHKDTEEKLDILKKIIQKQKKLIKGTMTQHEFDIDQVCCKARDECFIGDPNEEDQEKKLKDIKLKTIWFDILPYQRRIEDENEREEAFNMLKNRMEKIEAYEQEYISK